MAWTDLSAAFAYGSKLTSAQMQNLRDNFQAVAAGAAGAPRIVNSAVESGTLTWNRLAYKAGDVDQIGAGTTVSYYRVLGADGTWRRSSPDFDDSGT